MSIPIIMLVEDNPGDVALTLRALKKNNIANEVIVVQDGQEALDYLFCTGKYANRGPGGMPCVILLDIKLPKIDGIEVLRRVKSDERTQVIPVVMLTSSKEEEDVVRSYKLGANSYIRKPVDFDKFAETMKLLGMYWLLMNEPPPTAREK